MFSEITTARKAFQQIHLVEIRTKSLKMTCKGVHFSNSDLQIAALQILNSLTGIFGQFIILKTWKNYLQNT